MPIELVLVGPFGAGKSTLTETFTWVLLKYFGLQSFQTDRDLGPNTRNNALLIKAKAAADSDPIAKAELDDLTDESYIEKITSGLQPSLRFHHIYHNGDWLERFLRPKVKQALQAHVASYSSITPPRQFVVLHCKVPFNEQGQRMTDRKTRKKVTRDDKQINDSALREAEHKKRNELAPDIVAAIKECGFRIETIELNKTFRRVTVNDGTKDIEILDYDHDP